MGIYNRKGGELVGGFGTVITVTPTMDDDPDYSTGDVFGAKMTLTDALLCKNATGTLQRIILTTEDTLAASVVDVIIFDSDHSGTTFTDNSALALVDADLGKILGVVTLSEAYSVDTNSRVLQATNLALPLKSSVSEDLYAVMVARGTLALAVTDGVTVRFGIYQD